MSYKHILVAVDLTDESRLLVQKAASLARVLEAELSLIHIEQRYGEVYPGQVINQELLSQASEKARNEAKDILQIFKHNADYPIAHSLISSGHIIDELEDALQLHKFDLIVCGHHQDFWHTILSSAKQILRSTPIDLLIVPL